MSSADLQLLIQTAVDAVRGRSSMEPSPDRALPAGTDVPALIDHTLLKPEASRSDLEALCREAIEHGFATVCVNPAWVSACAKWLREVPRGGLFTAPRVCSVVGFPLGASATEVKRYEAERAIGDGAAEIDMVMNVGALKSGDVRFVERDIAAVVAACRSGGALSKVIIEAALLTDDEKIAACTIAQAAGAGYVKTSTGFGPGGATAADVTLMRRVVGDAMGVKAAGGIRDLKTLHAMVSAGATRIGTSAGVRILQEARGHAPAPSSSGY
jgi:deoxyribose-phosphate aldolase